jgi:hypothetical protein
VIDLLLQRQSASPIRTMGEMTIGGAFAAWTLERPLIMYPSQWNAVPAGTYPISLYPSPRFQRLMPLLDVPGHSGIEIHWGNWPANSHGCILVGTMKDDNILYNTREKFDWLFPIIQAAVNTEGCQITITDPQ